MTKPQPSRIVNEPATVEACQSDYGTPADRMAAAADAKTDIATISPSGSFTERGQAR